MAKKESMNFVSAMKVGFYGVLKATVGAVGGSKVYAWFNRLQTEALKEAADNMAANAAAKKERIRLENEAQKTVAQQSGDSAADSAEAELELRKIQAKTTEKTHGAKVQEGVVQHKSDLTLGRQSQAAEHTKKEGTADSKRLTIEEKNRHLKVITKTMQQTVKLQETLAKTIQSYGTAQDELLTGQKATAEQMREISGNYVTMLREIGQVEQATAKNEDAGSIEETKQTVAAGVAAHVTELEKQLVIYKGELAKTTADLELARAQQNATQIAALESRESDAKARVQVCQAELKTLDTEIQTVGMDKLVTDKRQELDEKARVATAVEGKTAVDGKVAANESVVYSPHKNPRSFFAARHEPPVTPKNEEAPHSVSTNAR